MAIPAAAAGAASLKGLAALRGAAGIVPAGMPVGALGGALGASGMGIPAPSSLSVGPAPAAQSASANYSLPSHLSGTGGAGSYSGGNYGSSPGTQVAQSGYSGLSNPPTAGQGGTTAPYGSPADSSAIQQRDLGDLINQVTPDPWRSNIPYSAVTLPGPQTGISPFSSPGVTISSHDPYFGTSGGASALTPPMTNLTASRMPGALQMQSAINRDPGVVGPPKSVSSPVNLSKYGVGPLSVPGPQIGPPLPYGTGVPGGPPPSFNYGSITTGQGGTSRGVGGSPYPPGNTPPPPAGGADLFQGNPLPELKEAVFGGPDPAGATSPPFNPGNSPYPPSSAAPKGDQLPLHLSGTGGANPLPISTYTPPPPGLGNIPRPSPQTTGQSYSPPVGHGYSPYPFTPATPTPRPEGQPFYGNMPRPRGSTVPVGTGWNPYGQPPGLPRPRPDLNINPFGYMFGY